MALFEIRVYPVKDGAMDEWIDFMEQKIVPYIEARGMKVDAMFRGEEDPNSFVWIRRFDDDAHRKSLYEAVYNEDWVADFKPTVRRLVNVENATVHVVTDTAGSPLN